MPKRKSLEQSEASVRFEAKVRKEASDEEDTSATVENKRMSAPQKKSRRHRHAVFRQFLKAVNLEEAAEFTDTVPCQQNNNPKPFQNKS
jgi:hypothetical protein